jgi:hypothetical protein
MRFAKNEVLTGTDFMQKCLQGHGSEEDYYNPIIIFTLEQGTVIE